MRLKEKNLLQKFAATLKKFSAQGAKKVEYSNEKYVETQDRTKFYNIQLEQAKLLNVLNI